MKALGIIRICSAVALLALVSGCELMKDIFPDEAAADPAAGQASEPNPSPEPPSQTAAVPPAATTRAPPRERPPPPPEIDPRRLVGLDKDETVAMLGQPAAVRDQPPSTVWTYRTPGCALDVFFFMDLSTRAFRVLTTELTTEAKVPDARRACLARLHAASRAP